MMKINEMNESNLKRVVDDTFSLLGEVVDTYKAPLIAKEVGTITFIGDGIARVDGLPNVKSDELVLFPGNVPGMVFNLDENEVSVILLEPGEGIKAGHEVRRTQRVLDVPVGKTLLGRVVDPMGRPLDESGSVKSSERRPIEREAPGIMERSPVSTPLQTGIQVIDALIPIGRGQRELIIGDRQTGKTAIALDTIINQKDKDVISIYCLVGERGSAVARLVDDLRKYGVMEKCAVVVATGKDSPGLKFIAPYAATTMAEYFLEQGEDVLIVYDDLTRHARAYRELSLLMRRPPAREAYPGDIFYIHSRLLERSTHLKKSLGGGSLTALPIVETQAQNISAYIPTNLVSITDGQIYLSPHLFREGILPAVDVGTSVSRVGGKTQLPAYRSVVGDLRLSYSQFEELEAFSRFGTRLDEDTQNALERGRRVREILKQPQYKPILVPEQIALLLSVTEGLFDAVPLNEIGKLKNEVSRAVTAELPEVCKKIMKGKELDVNDRGAINETAERVIQGYIGDTLNEDD